MGIVNDSDASVPADSPHPNPSPKGEGLKRAEMAIRFEKAFGVQADTMMRMQAAHDLADV